VNGRVAKVATATSNIRVMRKNAFSGEKRLDGISPVW
jgi:hypothetical protein